jgi:hypothetical protein
MTSLIFFVCLLLTAALVLASPINTTTLSYDCKAYMNPMNNDGLLGWADKWALMDLAVDLHCITSEAPKAQCLHYKEIRRSMYDKLTVLSTAIVPYGSSSSGASYVTPNELKQADMIGRWRLISYNDSLCVDPWAPDLIRASTILAPRLLSLLPGIERDNQANDHRLSWNEKWERFENMVEIACPAKNDLCETLAKRSLSQESKATLTRVWANVARLYQWSFDPWDPTSTTAHAHLDEFAEHPKVADVLKKAWGWGRLY